MVKEGHALEHHHLYDIVVPPIVLAHQGASDEAPSNTLPAFDLALYVGADTLETDIHWTRDNIPVVSHNPTVDSVSNGHGAIHTMKWRELTKFDFGYWFSTDDGLTYPFRGKGVKIPTLEEVLLRYPLTRINIDIKSKAQQNLPGLVRMFERLGVVNRVGIGSFHHQILVSVRKLCKALSTSASPREVADFLLSAGLFQTRCRSWSFDTLQVPIRQYGIRIISQRFMTGAKVAKIPVHVWTIDDTDEMKRLAQMGVSGIVTNKPRSAVYAFSGK